MIAVLTGDIINSQKADNKLWLPQLKRLFQQWSETGENWDIYRGDEFQVKCRVDQVFHHAILIKSLLKSVEQLDVRIAIGIGTEVYQSERITESNGTAYVNSGRLLTEIKSSGKTIAIQSENVKMNRDLNILLRWAALDMDKWTAATAEIIHQLLLNHRCTQDELAAKLNITQSSVSQRLKRANFELLQETDQYFRKKILEL